MTVRVVSVAGLLLVAVAWGVLGHAGDAVAGGRWLTSLGAPWLIVAFAAGAFAGPRPVRGALAGPLVLVVATAAYYAFFVHRGGSHLYAVVMTFGWSFAAMAAGAAAGWAGAAARGGDLRAALLPGAALLAEAVLLGLEWQSLGGRAAVLLEGAVGGVLLAAVLHRRPTARHVAVAVLLVLACLALEAQTRGALRTMGWAGA